MWQNWWMAQQTPPWFTPPPCPYPTTPNWNNPRPQQKRAQAHLTEIDITDPAQLEEGFQALHIDSGIADMDQWYMDSGATSHITGDSGKLTNPSVNIQFKFIFVGNGNRVPIHGSGDTDLKSPNHTHKLKNVLYTPHIVKNLISVRQFTTDNNASLEFDPFDFTVKDYKTGKILSRHDSSGQLYPFTSTASATICLTTTDFWHDRLGHPGIPIMNYFRTSNLFPCNKRLSSELCNSCQLSKHKRLPFAKSLSFTVLPFDIIHCDLWTSPILIKTCFKYYMVLYDDFTNYTWVYALKYKSETVTKFTQFHKYVQTQFNTTIKTFQCDLGGEFDNHNFKTFAIENGLQFRFSCPQTSQQNGKSERMIRRLNDIMFCILTHASLPNQFWVDALHTATYLHNILPSATHHFLTPTTRLYKRNPTYDHLRVFGCACYPNLSTTRQHKLAPRSTPCVFLGYPENFRGYRCLDLETGKIILSRHVTFDELKFPFATQNKPNHSFLEPETSPLISHPQTDLPTTQFPTPPDTTQQTDTTHPNPPPPPNSPTTPTPQTTTTRPPITQTYHRRQHTIPQPSPPPNTLWSRALEPES